jgi:hypothetical protein
LNMVMISGMGSAYYSRMHLCIAFIRLRQANGMVNVRPAQQSAKSEVSGHQRHLLYVPRTRSAPAPPGVQDRIDHGSVSLTSDRRVTRLHSLISGRFLHIILLSSRESLHFRLSRGL